MTSSFWVDFMDLSDVVWWMRTVRSVGLSVCLSLLTDSCRSIELTGTKAVHCSCDAKWVPLASIAYCHLAAQPPDFSGSCGRTLYRVVAVCRTCRHSGCSPLQEVPRDSHAVPSRPRGSVGLLQPAASMRLRRELDVRPHGGSSERASERLCSHMSQELSACSFRSTRTWKARDLWSSCMY
jgi:hypothetical protein